LGLGRAIIYSLISFIITLSPIITDFLSIFLGSSIPSVTDYETAIITMAIIIGSSTFIENYYAKTKTVVSGIFGIIEHLTYILWIYFALAAFGSIIIPYEDPVVGRIIIETNLAYQLIRDLIMAGLGIRLVIYLWQIAFYKDIQEPKKSEPTELRGKV
jgi:hypothetical protein